MPNLVRSFTSILFVIVGLLTVDSIVFAADSICKVRIRVNGGDSNAARVQVVGSDGKSYAPENVVLRKPKQGGSYFYTHGDFTVSLPEGKSRIMVSRGLESEPKRVMLDVQENLDLDLRVDQWIDSRKLGWFSGDSHVHLHTGGPIKVSTKDTLIAAQAEGLNFVNLCVSNNVGNDIRDANLITGKPHADSSKEHLLVFGEEMRSSIYGHMQFFGIKKLVEPQYTGFDNTPNHLDFPANYNMAAEAVRQGGVVTYGHPMFKNQQFPFGDDPSAGNAAARELPIDAILNVAQAIDLMSYNSDEDLSADLWYRLLNCGLKLSACVGTDALLDRSTDPMGGSRVYVNVAGSFNMKSWLEGLVAGRTFVTNGPIPRLTVNGTNVGGTTSMKRNGNVKVMIRVDSRVPFERTEVLMNGKVVSQRLMRNPGVNVPNRSHIHVQQYELNVPIERSSWIALRVRGADHEDVFDGPVWAHTSPVYVSVDAKPIRSVSDAKYFEEWIENLIRVVRVRNRYPSDKQRDEVIKLFRRAQTEFRKLAQ